MLVIGEEYPLPPVRSMLSKGVGLLQTGLMLVGIGGGFVPAINNHPLYQQFQQNRMLVMLGGYFGLNMLQNALSSSGAFEVSLNGTPIFSKLATNRMPTAEEILKHL